MLPWKPQSQSCMQAAHTFGSTDVDPDMRAARAPKQPCLGSPQSTDIFKIRSIHIKGKTAYPTLLKWFNTDLRILLRNVPANDKIVILGHFHARVGRDSETWKGALGKYGAGNYSDNGRILLELCAEQQLCFHEKDRLKNPGRIPDQNTGT